MTDLEEVIRKHVLKNAFDYGSASTGHVVGKVIAEYPNARKDMKGTMKEIEKIVTKVNALQKGEIEKQLSQYSFIEKKQEEKKLELPEVKGKVVTRFPPEPNGYPHIGHAKAAFLNTEAARVYNGTCFLRWDDTNPETEKEEYVDAIRSGLEWLGLSFEKEYYTSDFMPVFYEKAEQLISQSDAYVCKCNQEEISKNREEKKKCACRSNDVEANLKLWSSMKSGKLKQGSAILRLAGDMLCLNTVMRDPTLFRVINSRHFRQGKKYPVWPNYDFSVCIADSLQGVTHALRSKEYELRDELYYYILDKLKMRKPIVYGFSRLNLQGTKLSKRFLLPLVKEKKVNGWSDPRLPTLAGLRRRGLLPVAIKHFVLSFGLSKVESNPSFDALFAENKKLLEPIAKHFFFVPNPVEIKISNIITSVKEEAAKRNFEGVTKTNRVYIPGKEIHDGEEVRLKGLASVRLNGKTGEVIESVPEKKLQWVFVDKSVKTKLLVVGDLVKGDEFNDKSLQVVEGVCPRSIFSLAEGEMVQFERIGFCRFDKKTKAGAVFVSTS